MRNTNAYYPHNIFVDIMSSSPTANYFSTIQYMINEIHDNPSESNGWNFELVPSETRINMQQNPLGHMDMAFNFCNN